MSDNELLLAISDMMDKKFETNLRPIRDDISNLKSDVAELKGDVAELKTDVAVLKVDVAVLQDNVAVLRVDVDRLQDNVAVLNVNMENVKGEVSELKGDVAGLKGEVSELKSNVARTNLYLENNINPRLQNIESCYTDTYYRYKDNSDRMESALDDIVLLKKVVTEHSAKLKSVG